MILLKIAFENILRHKRSVLVLVSVFVIASLVMFWVFGVGNSAKELLIDAYRGSYGDLAFFTDYVNKEKLKAAINDITVSVYDVVFEREARGMYQDTNESGFVNIVEITNKNYRKIEKYIRPVRGRIPREIDEIMIPAYVVEDSVDINNYVYLILSTPQGIMNTLKYRVCGICRSSAVKGFGEGFLITEKSMDLLLNSNDYVNMFYVYVDYELGGREKIEQLFTRYKSVLTNNDINITNAFTIYDQFDMFRPHLLIASALKVIIMIVIFPLIGAVVAALVWMYVNKRRKEIWTYVALGLKDRAVFTVMALEYWLIGLFGIAMGLTLGLFSSALVVMSNIWIQFSYTLYMPLIAKIGLDDIVIIHLFILGTIFIWLFLPLNKVIKAKPFSY